MWIVTQKGFYSVVAYDHDLDPMDGEKPSRGTHLLVRARARADLEALRQWIPELTVREDSTADYRLRTVVSRVDWNRGLVSESGMVDYTSDFKGRVGQVLGMDREALYTQVWAILRGIRG
jgi:hypothetical protein